MKTEVIRKNNTEVALISSDELLITDVQSALDLIMTVKYETGCTNIAVNKEAIVNDFFVLSTCLAGEILQKCVYVTVHRLCPFPSHRIHAEMPKHTALLHGHVHIFAHGRGRVQARPRTVVGRILHAGFCGRRVPGPGHRPFSRRLCLAFSLRADLQIIQV